MATAPDPLIAWLLDELQPLAAQIGEIRARRMFGGAGLYHDDIVFALVTRGTCYLRVDDVTRARLAAEGGTPFQYERAGRTITIAGYLSTPADALDGGQPLRDWVRLAIEAARRAANAKAARPKRAPAKSVAAGQTGTKKKAPARKTTARAKR
ncbi:TfoX/Sxy family protein [Ralstonia pseudosolanacearum]|uniref:TfoX/Sxy family protein n=1 Tax=Ralstonia pseudosolanacearum TaxID=1310165 RepID=UPI00186681CB|nr:TfoX/Sxy family protein [Ralstonia pseudosolanacearum]QOK93152.1 TfoX/Sxy family protein [Ralstonia pseudosolanacearum]